MKILAVRGNVIEIDDIDAYPDTPVLDLKPEDFALSEDGKPQKLTHFAAENIPLELVAAIDVSGSMAGHGPLLGQAFSDEREDALLRKLVEMNRGRLPERSIRAIYREIMSAALALEKPLCVAYLGPEATNTHAAALRKFGSSVEYRPMPTIADIFTAVEKGETDYGVVPVENSTEGSVRDSLDLFVETPLKIVAEIQAKHIVIATGSKPAPLKGVTFDGDRIGGSTEALVVATPLSWTN